MPSSTQSTIHTTCFHCGEQCDNESFTIEDKKFCCQGCKMVYQLLNEHELCDYYSLNNQPGINQESFTRKEKFSFLDDKKIQAELISFSSDDQVHVNFYLPQMHCSSCLYLLENLYRVNQGVISSTVNFTRKEANVIYNPKETNLRSVVETLTAIGYEPYISLQDLKEKRQGTNKALSYQLGVAAFCFGNIMLMSFPEYLGIDTNDEFLRGVFRWSNMALAIPVLLFSALPFFQSSLKSIRHRFLNIDLPIALAILITFVRSAYEVISGTGGGYFDSMSGIVFFMLAGRILQDKTYRQLSFERDYCSYFPIAVSVVKDGQEVSTILPNLKPGDTLIIRHGELIPADGILTRGKALIDYSFVTGESLPILKEMGEIVYAGGKQTGGEMEILLVKEVAQSYLTKLWNNDNTARQKKQEAGAGQSSSFVHRLSKYFTILVLAIASATAFYWGIHDATKLWPAVTAVFIIACPCALLLANNFTNGNVLRILGVNELYLRNAVTIESFSHIDHIVFDKTGTLTNTEQYTIQYEGKKMTSEQQAQVAAIASCSSHPLSQALFRYLQKGKRPAVKGFQELIGEGVEGFVNDDWVRLGSATYCNVDGYSKNLTQVFVKIEDTLLGCYRFTNSYRENIEGLIATLKRDFRLSVISGDNDGETQNLQKIFGEKASLFFYQQPADKLAYIEKLQATGEVVMMIGDGLNDAGAFQQSDVAIAIAAKQNNFTPASDGIIRSTQLTKLPKFISLCKANKQIVVASFVLSIVYNVVGLLFAVQGILNPLIAAILMPLSSISIVLITYGFSNWIAKRMSLKV